MVRKTITSGVLGNDISCPANESKDQVEHENTRRNHQKTLEGKKKDPFGHRTSRPNAKKQFLGQAGDWDAALLDVAKEQSQAFDPGANTPLKATLSGTRVSNNAAAFFAMSPSPQKVPPAKAGDKTYAQAASLNL